MARSPKHPEPRGLLLPSMAMALDMAMASMALVDMAMEDMV